MQHGNGRMGEPRVACMPFLRPLRKGKQAERRRQIRLGTHEKLDVHPGLRKGIDMIGNGVHPRTSPGVTLCLRGVFPDGTGDIRLLREVRIFDSHDIAVLFLFLIYQV